MSVIDILTRVDAICQKYDKYDVEKPRETNVVSNDGFASKYAAMDNEIKDALQKAEMVSKAKDTPNAISLKVEIRRTKNTLINEVSQLSKLADKKVKGLSADELAARKDMVLALSGRIHSIPDAYSAATNKTAGWRASTSRTEIKLDSDGQFNFNSEYFQVTEESNQFKQEYEMRKLDQDKGLDVISEGLHTLKNMAHDMNEELDRQVPLMDEIDTKVDRATHDLKSNNVRLKNTVNQLRSSRNFCVDIILLCIILGIAAYLYNVLK